MNVPSLSSILPVDVGTSKSKSSNGGQIKVSFPNSGCDSNLTDLDNLDKINKLKNELENYQKMLTLKLNADSNGQSKEVQRFDQYDQRQLMSQISRPGVR